MSKPIKSRYVLPVDVDPTERVCFQVMVPKDRQHIAAFMGAIYGLSKPYEWQNDTAHTALAVGAVWKQIFDNLRSGDCAENTIVIEEMELEMAICEQLRFENGKLQGLCCGEWTDIPGQGDATLGGSSQPGGGSVQPDFGQSQCYSGRLLGTGLWQLPTIVSAGDTIEITDPKGAWHDGAFSAWRCPDGNIFFAGGCVASTATDAGDPLPAQPHMSLILKVGGTFYPAITGGIFTVPGGITDQEVTFQANDGTLTDNAGEISFSACVTNNQSAGFEHRFDFLASDCGFVSSPGGRAVWTSGQGWGIDPGGSYPGLFQIQSPTVSPRDFDYAQALLTVALTGHLPNFQVRVPDVGGTDRSVNPNGSSSPVAAFVPTNGAGIWIGIQSDERDAGSGGVTFSGYLTRLIIRGSGTDPF